MTTPTVYLPTDTPQIDLHVTAKTPVLQISGQRMSSTFVALTEDQMIDLRNRLDEALDRHAHTAIGERANLHDQLWNELNAEIARTI